MFLKILNGDSNNENTNSAPNEKESREFWKKIWCTDNVYNKDAEWLSNIKSELLNLDREEDITISKKDLRKILQKPPHWKTLGKDGLQGYWMNVFKSLHDQLLNFLNLCLQSGKIPDWMVWRKSVVTQKDLSKDNIPSNYRPITCLANVWKILTGIISDKCISHWIRKEF